MANLADTWLPLSGGKITGKLSFPFGKILSTNTSSFKELIIGSDTDGTGEDGAFISLRNNNSLEGAGCAYISTRLPSGGSGPALVLCPNGEATYNQKKLSLIDSSGTNWIRYENGWQIVRGADVVLDGKSITKTFPVPFKSWLGSDQVNATYSVLLTVYANEGGSFDYNASTTLKPESVIFNASKTIGFTWVAFGRWK